MTMQSFLIHYTYWALLLFAFIEACCIPISSEVTFGYAGVLAYQGHLNLVLVIVVGVLAEFAGSMLSYGVGRKGGRPAVDRLGKYVLLTQKDVDRAERFFAGRGAWAVGVARIIPLLRAFIGLVAGLIEIPVGPFALFNLIGTAIWAIALTSIGYALGGTWTTVSKYMSIGGYLIALVIVVPIVVIVALRLREFRRERGATALAGEAAPPAPTTPSSSGAPAAPDAPARPASHRRGAPRR
jgi:membrane protein DedA with SNARE-associated domain